MNKISQNFGALNNGYQMILGVDISVLGKNSADSSVNANLSMQFVYGTF